MKTPGLAILSLAAALTIAGCGGGTGGTGAAAPATSPAVSTGVMTKGSIIVNGVRFDDTAANIVIRIDDRNGTRAELQNGMHVKVRGQINDDRINGTAERVEVENEVRGEISGLNTAVTPATFKVIGQTAYVDDLTVFAGVGLIDVNGLANTDYVEVHGLRDASGAIHASRVDRNNLLAGTGVDELRGSVLTAPTPTTFTLPGGITVTYSGTPTVSVGMRVEVHGSQTGPTTFTATLVDNEDLEDAPFEHAAGEDFSIEGQVSGCTVPCASFTVRDRAVLTNGSTRYENGNSLDLANNITVEAEGHQFDGSGKLIAEKIHFERSRVILTGTVTAVTGTIVSGTGNTGTVTVLGQIVQVTTLTEVLATGGITATAPTDRVEVRGYMDKAGKIVAERLDDNASGGNKDIVQARVTAKNGNVLTLLGINATLSGATTFSGAPDLATFLAAVTPAAAPGGTLVKVKGTFTPGAPGNIAVDEAELEN